MADFNSVFDQYMAANTAIPTQPASVIDAKKASVTAAAEQKKSAMGGTLPSFDQAYQTSVGGSTGQGLNTMSEVEQDIRTLRPIQLRAKYGDRQAAALMGQANLANQAVLLDNSTTRSDGQVARDTAVDIASGFVLPVLDIGAFGLGLVNDNAGVIASQGLEKLNNFVRNDLQSDELGQRRRLNEARNALDSRDSKAQQDIDLANGDSELLAGLKRFGRGAINSVSNASDDSAILGSGIANGVGSLLSGSVMAKGAASILPIAAKGLAFPTTIGMMEGSGVYQQTVSSSYDKLIAQGVPHDEAVEKATDAGTTAFAIAFPAAVGLSKVVQGFEQNPLGKTTTRQALGNTMLREPFEEGSQSAAGQAAQNFGTKLFVDPSQDMYAQVGEQFGEGALYGMGTAGAISAPSIAANTVTDTPKYLWGKASGAMADAAAKLTANNEAASPLAPNKVAAEVTATQAAMPETAATIQAGIDTSSLNQEEKAEGQAYAGKLTGALSYGENDLAELTGHPLATVLSGSTGKADAIAKLAALVREGGDQPSDVQVAASYLLHGYVADLTDAIENKPAFLDKLPADHPAVQSMASIQATLAKVTAQPMVKKILDQVTALAEAENAKAGANLTEQSMATPEGQLAAQNAANAIAYDPAKANPALVNAVLAHAASGKLVLTEKQQRGIDVAKTLFDMSREDFANRERLGLKTQDVVSNQIQSAEYLGEGQLSAAQHASKIYQAYRANDIVGAKFQLEDMRKFAESIQNKLAAFNQHLQNGESSKAVPYVTLGQTDRMFKNAETGVFVRPKNESSIRLMQDVAADAKMIAAAYNNLKDTFPELNGQELKAVALDSRIDKPAAEVVATFKTGAQPDASPATLVVESKPEAEPKKKTKKAVKPAVPDSQMSLDLVPVADPVVDKKEEKVNTSPESVQEKTKTEQVAKATLGPTTETGVPVSLVQLLDGIATGVSSTGLSKFVPNAEQAEGIANIRKFLYDRTGGNIFVLEGKAGTGKTSLIQEAVAPYLKDGGTVVVAAVSHKAKGVLEQKLANFIQSNKLRGKVKAHSVAGLLGMKRDEATGDFVEDPYAESSVDQVQVLVVDEASMVNVQNKRILESRLPANAKLIYLGDRNQIAPIEKKGSPNLGKISQVFTMDTGTNKHSLVTRVRQGEDSTILPYADHYWNNAENGNSVADPVPAADRTNSGELVMLPSLGWVDQVIPLFKKAFAAGNANLVKVMAFNNMENATSGAVMLRNAERKIREAMFGKDLLEYNKGELLIMTNSFGRGDEKLENSAELLALRSTPTTVDVLAADGSMVTLDAFQLTVEDTITGKTVTVPVVAESSKARHKAIYEGWGNLAKSGQRSAWKMFWEVKEQTFAPVAYSYILTTHKAQGSTYDVAVVLEDNIQTSPDTAANKSRIMYTAITRASKMAVIISGKNTEQPLIAKPAVEPKNKVEPVAAPTPAVAEPIAPAAVSSLVQEEETDPIEEEDTAEPAEYKGKETGLRIALPNLFGIEQTGNFINRFVDAFIPPAEPTSRVSLSDDALETVWKALKSDSALGTFMEGSAKPGFTLEVAEAYQAYLAQVGEGTSTNPGVLLQLQKQMKDFLYAPMKNGKKRIDLMMSPTFAGTWKNGKLISLLENTKKGLQYDSKLLEGAVLAGLQWLISSDQLTSKLTDEAVANILGIDGAVPAGVADMLNVGQSQIDALSALTSKIQNYWGLKSNKDYPLGHVVGIPASMAAEVLRAFEELGLMEKKAFNFDANGYPSGKGTNNPASTATTHSRLIINMPKEVQDILAAYPDAIEQAVMVTPEQVVYLEDERPEVARTQMRNPMVKNSRQQIATIEANQETPYKVTPIYKLYESLGVDNLLKLFGFGNLSQGEKNTKFNKNHLVSIEGKNQGIMSAMAGMDFVMGQVKHRAEALGKPVEDIAIHYGFNMSKVSRLQMIGRATPQGDKLVRAALSPHDATLNLNNKTGKDYQKFLLSLAQAVGVRVHEILPNIVHKRMQSLLNKELAESVGVLQEWLKDGQGKIDNSAANIFIGNFKIAKMGLSELALQALTEYARYLNTTKNSNERKGFKTKIYVEADGMNNGPANAMMMHTTGPFTVDQLNKMTKVGYYPGQMNRTAQENFKDDSHDLYRTASVDLAEELPKMLKYFKAQSPQVGQQMEHLLNLMSLLFGKDIKFDGNDLVIERGITKNPLTITIYGSGTKGIATKLVSQLSDVIYEKMSDLAAASTEGNVSKAEIMFGTNVEQARTKYSQFTAAMVALTNNQVWFSKEKGVHYLKNVPSNVKRTAKDLNEYAVNFTLGKGEIDNLVSNMLTLFVIPLKQAIDRTVGESLLTSMDLIQKATQIQSLYLENAFQVEIERALDKKEKDDPSFRRSDFLSENELNAIRQKLKYMVPTINTGTQEYFIAGSASADVESATEYGSSLNDQYKTPAFVYGPRDAGVSGTASINIGAGDAQMVQNIYSQPDRPTRTMPVFDGINFSLDTFEDDSRKANKAAFDAWMGNPLEAIYKSFDTFMQDTDTSMKQSSPVLFEKLSKMFFGMKVDLDTVDNAMIQEGLQGIRESLKAFSLQTEARHRALKQIGASVDQMAAASAPHQHAGSVSVEGLSREEIVTKLNELYEAEYTKLVPEKNKNEDITDALFGENKGQLIIATSDGLPFLGSKMNIPKDQKWMFDELTKSKALAGWTFIAGTKEQIREEALKRGVLEEHLNNLEKGLMVQAQQLILLPTSSSETLVHEMIHAATFSTIYQHYSGTLEGNVAASVAPVVERLKGLMDQFIALGEELPTLSTETMQQYLHARSVIQGHLNQGDNALAKASALNEFMAYTQSNQALIRMAKNTKVSALVRIAKEVLEAIKEMIWGKRAPRVGGDMFTNVRFNTALLARYQPSVGQTAAAANAALAHTDAAVSNPRLQELRDYFLKQIPNHLATPVDRNNFGVAAANITAVQRAAHAAITANRHGFVMNHLEDSTFRAIVHALATQASIDPNSMARAQELFTLATKTLKVDDFLDPTNPDPQSAQYYANEQYNTVMGNYFQGTDKLGRSTLLPVFLGLAMVNNHFRSVLSKLELPKSKLKEWNTADNAFENLGKMGLDALSLRLTGEGKHAPNVQAALDALTNHLLDTAQDDLSLAEQTMGKIGTKVSAMNDWVVSNIGKVSGVTTQWAKNVLADSTSSKYKKALANAAELTAGIVNEDTANGVAEGITSVMNRLDGFKTLREMLSDIVGRTENTAELYDANKVVRSMVSQDRQHYRDGLPEIIRSKFSREVTDLEMTAMFYGLGKTDIAVLRETMNDAEIRELFTKTSALPVAIRAVEAQLKTADPKHWNQVEKKARQYAGFMNGKGAGTNLLRNAEAVSGLFMEKVDPKRVKPDDAFIKAVDKLITLYALDGMYEAHRNNLSSLVQSEAGGVDFVMAYLTGQRAEEMRKAQASFTSRVNYFKGYVPSEQDGGVSLIVANDSEFAKLVGRSFTKVAEYSGSSLIGGEPKSYYFAKVPGRAPYNQGTMQNVRQTAGGIDLATGFTDGMMVAGRITDPRLVYRLAQNMANERATNEPLMPVYNDSGAVVAFERAVGPRQLERLKHSTDLVKMIGVWRGRQVEEAKVQVFNEALVDAAKRMHKADMQAGRGAEYINVFDPREQKKDPVLADAVKLLNPETLEYLEKMFGEDNFPVRRDMINDMLGYRNATVGDMWTGNHRWSPETENAVKNIAVSVFGNDAYRILVNGEKTVQNVMSSAKTLIVMKSVVIPMANLIGNMYQLISRGVPHMSILRGLPRKTLEIDNYAKSRRREIEAEAELRAAVGNDVATRRLTTELQSIKDSHARMSIWPLIQAGQFSAISDMGVSRDEVNLTEGKLHDYIEGLVNRLPEGVRNAGRYAVITKDTALFRGLQKSVDYGDFIAKAVLFDHLTKQKGMTNAEALARITEEFVNYDKLPGRTRGYLENMGLLWFYNFKLRLVKVALSTIRNNPVHALMVGMAPKPTFFGSIGTPISDNFATMLVNGELGNSVGLGMALNAPTLNPWVNAFD